MIIKLVAVIFLLCLVLRSAISQDPVRVINPSEVEELDTFKLIPIPLIFDNSFLLDIKSIEDKELDLDVTNNQLFYYRDTYQKALIVPAVICLSGLYIGDRNLTNSPLGKRTVNDYLNETFPDFHTSADDYLQYAPILAVYALNLSGIQGKNDYWTATKLLALSEALTGGVVHAIKNVAANERPSGANHKSFPSGHTAQSFVAATFLHREYGHLSRWYSVGGYTIATSVGALRMVNNAHWLNDVCVGAALGIAITNLVYIRHGQQKEKKKRKLLAIPSVGEDSYMMTFNYKL
ncbi:phosphatase PAP2 family protein [bacterium]|nr:phosphatase PAP2 family protein [bacterium]